jgi:hypothetical protein
MRHPRAPLALTLVLVIGLLVGLPEMGHAEFVLYDDFSAGIDPAKWYGSSIDGNSDTPSTEVVRRVENGKLHLSITSYGNNHSGTGTPSNRVDLRPKLLGTRGGPGYITGMKVNMTVLGVKAQGCGPDNPQEQFISAARAQMLGFFFHDGTPIAPTNDRTGTIGFSVALVKLAPSDYTGLNQITGNMFRCLDAGCNSSTVIGNLIVFQSSWVPGEVVPIKLTWDNTGGRKFVVVAKGEKQVFPYPDALLDVGPAPVDFKALRVQNNIENCPTGYRKGVMDVLFDEFMVRRQ